MPNLANIYGTEQITSEKIAFITCQKFLYLRISGTKKTFTLVVLQTEGEGPN